jgi:hypothetical protein
LGYKAFIDEDQNIGTLIGLKNKLVLRGDALAGFSAERRVLIAWGEAHIGKNGIHVNLSIDRDENSKHSFFIYRLDRHLQKLRGVPDLRSQLPKACSHAVTSHLFRDPFNGTTGTEEALGTLKEAPIYCVALMNEEENCMLNEIASLTPQYTKALEGKTFSQKISWNDQLLSIVQRGDSVLAAKAIVAQHPEADILISPDTAHKSGLRHAGDCSLSRRARERHASVIRCGLFKAVMISEDDDKLYESRDWHCQSTRAVQVHEITPLVALWSTKSAVHTDLSVLIKGWKEVHGYHASSATASLQETVYLEFRQHWGSLYELCRTAERDSATYAPMFTFCPIAFGTDNKHILILKIALAFAFNDAFCALYPPEIHSTYGTHISQAMVARIISSKAPPPTKAQEIFKAVTKVKYAARQSNHDAECPHLLDCICSQQLLCQ